MSPTPFRAGEQPYPGIRPFREDEEYLFFGRETQVDALVDTLARRRFLAVIGSSGSGKSSLVNCGLRPALHRGLLTRAGSAWRMATCRPGSNPVKALAEALARPGALLGSSPCDGLFSPAELIEATLSMSRTGLVDAFHQAALPPETSLLIVVDQFEELFRYRSLAQTDENLDGQDPATAFVNLLLEARERDQPIYVVLTLRSDFLGDCARFAGLPEAINQSQYLVPRMSRDERRAAILGPARVCGADIAPPLLTRLVNDVGDDPDQLSLLQHALSRTWQHWRASGDPSPIQADHYDAVGTLAHALNQHAEEIHAALPASHQAICAAALRALTDTSTDSRGIRRPTRFDTLSAICATSPDELAATLAPFRAVGAAFLMPPEDEDLKPDTVIDLAHESLMRLWDRLRGWSEREMESARMLRRLGDAAELHAAGQASLWRDPELQLALDWRQRNQPGEAWARQYGRALAPALAFLDASRAAREQAQAAEAARLEAERVAAAQQRRNRRVWRLTVSAIILSTLVAGVTGALWLRAESATQIALSRQMAAQSVTELLDGGLNRALLFAAAAFEYTPSFEARDALLASLVHAPKDWSRAGQNGIQALARSPDGRLMASGGRDGSIKLWSPESGQLIATLASGQGRVRCLAFSPNGTRLASGGTDGSVVLWDVASRKPLLPALKGHQGSVLAVSFSPGGFLASAGVDRQIILRNGASGQVIGEPLIGHGDTITALAFSPDGLTLASVGFDGNLLIWDPGISDAPIARAAHGGVLHDVAYAPDGLSLATASADRHIVLWDARQLTPIGEPLIGHQGVVRRLAFSPDGRRLASVSDDQRVIQWDLSQRGSTGLILPGHAGPVTAVAFAADGLSFFSGGEDDYLIRHALPARGPLSRTLDGPGEAVWALAWSPDGQTLAMVEDKARIRLRDARSGTPRGPALSAHQALVTSLAYSPDGTLLASAGQDGRLFLWDLAHPEAPPRALIASGPPLTRATFSPDGQHLAAAGRDGLIRLWSVPAFTPMAAPQQHGGPVADLSWSADATLLASAGYEGGVQVWDIRGHKVARLPPGDAGAIYRLAWSRDGRTLFLATQKGGLMQWPRGAALPETLLRDTGPLLHLGASPDGAILAAADQYGHVRLWDPDAHRALREPLLRHGGPVLAMAWAPDSRQVATAGWDRGVQLSRTAAIDWQTKACQLVQRNPPEAAAALNPCPQRGTTALP